MNQFIHFRLAPRGTSALSSFILFSCSRYLLHFFCAIVWSQRVLLLVKDEMIFYPRQDWKRYNTFGWAFFIPNSLFSLFVPWYLCFNSLCFFYILILLFAGKKSTFSGFSNHANFCTYSFNGIYDTGEWLKSWPVNISFRRAQSSGAVQCGLLLARRRKEEERTTTEKNKS